MQYCWHNDMESQDGLCCGAVGRAADRIVCSGCRWILFPNLQHQFDLKENASTQLSGQLMQICYSYTRSSTIK